jgi:hypothetical protein
MYRLSTAQFYVRAVYTSSYILRAYSLFYASSPFLSASRRSCRVALCRFLSEVRTKYLHVAAGIAKRHNIKTLIKYRTAALFLKNVGL